MNDNMSNAPISESRASSVVQTWITALTKPSEQTFANIAASPNAKASTAYLWVFVAYLIQIFLSALVSNRALQTLASQYGYGDVFANRGLGATLVSAVCGAPIGAVIGTILFVIGVFVIQWLARMFGGRGTTDQLAYALSSVVSPYLIVSGIVGLFSAIPFVGLCFSAILALGGIYILVLEIMAVKGVNQVSWGAAIGSVLIPVVAIALLIACVLGVSFAALMSAFRNGAPNFNP
jgi:hypothetical protein